MKTKPAPGAKRSVATPCAAAKREASAHDLDTTLAWLERQGTRANREGLARYGIVAKDAYGVSVGELRARAKAIGRDHGLADALWKSGRYEARLLAIFVADPARVTPAQMERWCRDFDNWALCDTACFHLFDRTPHAFAKVAAWAEREPEFEKRAAFALLASLAGHDRASGDAPFRACLAKIERAASDPRNFVKKGVSWALRGIGHRSAALHAESVAVARALAGSSVPAKRWVGKDALRDLERAIVVAKVRKRGAPA